MSEPTPLPGLLGHQIHDDLEYAVGGVYTRDAALAIVLAVETALGAGDGAAVMDVIVWSEAGARAYGGDAFGAYAFGADGFPNGPAFGCFAGMMSV